MYAILPIAALAAVAQANPLALLPKEANEPVIVTGGTPNLEPESGKPMYMNNGSLTRCLNAPNCELYEQDSGHISIRFKAGMEPGTDHYRRNVLEAGMSGENALDKRYRAAGHTNLDYGHNKMQYGSRKASGDDGAVHHLYDRCIDSSCDTNPLYLSTNIAGCCDVGNENIVLHADGTYDSGDRHYYIDSLVAAAPKGETCVNRHWTHGTYGGGYVEGYNYQCTQANYMNVDRYTDSGNLMGFLHFRVEIQQVDSAQCAIIKDASSAIVGAFSGIGGGFWAALLEPFC